MRSLALLAFLLPFAASATTVDGGTVIATSVVWTAAGNPYNVSGDITVGPAGTLTLEPGVQVVFSVGDSTAGGASTTRGELIVNGSLQINGQSGTPVTFTAGGAQGAWYGIRVGAAATNVSIAHATLSNAIDALTLDASATVANLTVVSASQEGVTVGAGTATLSGLVIGPTSGYGLLVSGSSTANVTGSRFTATDGVWGDTQATLNLSTSQVVSTNGYGLWLYGNGLLHHNTVVGSTGYGAYVAIGSAANNLTVRDNIFANNLGSGVYDATNFTFTFNNNLSWGSNGNNTVNFGSFSPAANATNFSANPLFVGGSNYRLTSNSPARFADSAGADLGALPFTGDTTVGLQGTLWTNTTFGGNLTLAGDLTVPAGVTLTVDAGTILTPAAPDGMGAGVDTARTELIVNGGTLLVNGTAQSPVTITAGGSAGAWHGIRVLAGTGTNLQHARLSNLVDGLYFQVSAAASNISITSASGSGAAVYGGTATLDGITVATATQYGLFATGPSTVNVTNSRFTATDGVHSDTQTTLNLSNSVISNTNGYGLELYGNGTVHHNTVVGSTGYGAYIAIGSAANTLTLRDNIFASNADDGAYDATNFTFTFNNNLSWGSNGNNTVNFGSFSPAANATNFSANPLFVGGSNYRLTSNSPARFAGTGATDLGALPFTGDPTVGLQGTLWTNTTLSGSLTLAGDLTVPAGVTLTVDAGTILTPAAPDNMGGGRDSARTELIVSGGTLLVNGTAQSPVTITAGGSAGAWHGIRVLAGTGTNLQHAQLSNLVDGLYFQVSAAASNVSIASGSGSGVVVYGGTATLDGITVASATQYGLYAAGPSTVNVTGSSFTATDGIYVDPQTTLNLSNSVISNTNGYGLELYGNGTVHHNTVVGSTGYGAYVALGSAANTLTLRDNIFANNADDGVYDATNFTFTFNNNLSWGSNGNNTVNFGSFSPAANATNFSANPLFVGGSNYRLTSNSPARFAGTGASDLGALPFTGDPTVGLQGTLWTNTTLGGNLSVAGDLTVPPGVTLTIDAGTNLTPASPDGMGAGVDTARTELIVNGGTLLVNGTAQRPVTITAGGSAGAWYGIRVLAGAGTNLQHANLSNLVEGLYFQVSGSASNVSIANASGSGVVVYGGTATLDGITVASATQYGLYAAGPSTVNVTGSSFAATDGIYVDPQTTLNLSNSVISNTNGYGLELYGNGTVHHNTVVGSTGYGAYVALGSAANTLTLRDNIFANNADDGVYDATSFTFTFNNNLSWGSNGNNTVNFGSFSPAANATNFSANPLFVGGSNYRLTSNSPARFAGTGATDLGALPFTGDATSGLLGTLWSDLTLSGNVTLAGDLVVPAGRTLTLSAGTTVTPAVPDGMSAGIDNARTELIANGGTILVNGTSVSPVVITAGGSAGAWYGVRLLAGTSSNLQHLNLSNVVDGLTLTTSATASNISVTSASSEGLVVTSGTASINKLTVQTATDYGVRLGPSATLHLVGGRIAATDGVYSEVGSTLNASYLVVSGNSGYGFQIYGSGTVHHNTVANNSGTGLYAYLTNPDTLTVRDNISAFNSGFGLQRGSGSVAITLTTNDAFSNTSGNYSNLTQGANLAVDPLFVAAPSDYRLSSGSPAIAAGSSGSDLGALPFAAGAVNRVVVSPASPTVGAGQSQTFTAQAFDVTDAPLDGITFVWSASSAAGTINASTGVLTASCTPGSAVAGVTATANGRSGSANVTIVPGPTSQVAVAPGAVSVAAGGTQGFTATTRDACNNLTSTPVTWSVSGAPGSINGAGLLAASCTTGTYNAGVVATAGTVTGTANVVVVTGPLNSLTLQPQNPSIPAGGQQQFTANAADSCSNAISPPPSLTWTVENGGGAINGSGLFTAGLNPGSFTNTVKVASGNVSRTTGVTVTANSIATVEVSPPTVSLARGGTQTFTAVAKDSSNNVVPGTPTWGTVADGGTIHPSTGEFTAGQVAGGFNQTVRASIGGFHGFATVTVQPGPTSRTTVSPPNATVAPGGVTTFSAQTFDSTDNLTNTTVTWTMLNSAAGSINAAGQFTASQTPGVYSNAIQASSNGATAVASVTVSGSALVTLELTPGSAQVRVGGTLAFAVTGRGSDGGTVATPGATFAVVQGGGTVSSAGVFTAGTVPGSYANTVQVQVGGLAATATVVVTPGPVVQIAVTPANSSVDPGATVQYAAKTQDAFGNPVASAVAWSADANAGTISADGLFTALGSGSYPAGITATVDGLTGTAAVTVTGTPGTTAKVGCGCQNAEGTALPAAFGLLLLAFAWRRRSHAGQREPVAQP